MLMLTKSLLPSFVGQHHKKIVIYTTVSYLCFSLMTSTLVSSNLGIQDPFLQYLSTVIASVFLGVTWWLILSLSNKISSYSESIKGSKESTAFAMLSSGLWILFVSIVITSILNLVRVEPGYSPLFKSATIAIYYTAGLLSFVYLSFIGRAGYELAKMVNKKQIYFSFLVFTGAIVGWFALIFWSKVSSLGSYGPEHILAYLDSNLVFYSLFIFTATGWALALASVIGVALYQIYVKGNIYGNSMLWVSAGISSLILVSTSRHFSDYLSGSFSYLSLPNDLFRVTALLSIVILACLATNKGMDKLIKIESVS
jgi:hypothetical protein